MPVSPYIVHALKYATLTLVAAVIVIAGAALMKDTNTGSLAGRLVAPQQSGVTPTLHIEAQRAVDGFSVPADTNVIFTVPDGVRIPRITFLGGQDKDQNVPYWGYCYSGREASNRAAGKTGSELYDGRFFYSLAERRSQEDTQRANQDTSLLGMRNSNNQEEPRARASIAEIFNGNDTCYIMSSAELPAAIDSDGDDLNNKREQLLGTNPKEVDTDKDGATDGKEVFVMKTAPLEFDSDRDSLSDRCEDKNMNGTVDSDETSPFNADTDRDQLCDGNALNKKATGCPEPKQVVCRQDANNERVCDSVPTSPVHSEDIDQNCEVTLDSNGKALETDPTKPESFGGVRDWDYKWNLLGGAPRVGTPAPAFPIPDFPSENSSSAR